MSNNFLPLLADRLFGRPLLATPALAEMVAPFLDGRVDGLGAKQHTLPEASRFIGTRQPRARGYSLARIDGSTALITIDGPLVNRGAWIDANCGLTSYEGIGAQVREAEADSSIRGVILDLNSGGGEATGMFAAAAAIRQLAKSKYVVAVVNDLAASAAYGLASAADEIVISPTSIVGSIGVVMLHLDRSAEMAAKGVRPTLIHAGAHKVDGNPFEQLSEEVRATMQRDLDAMHARFLETVALGRGTRLTAAAARATEAKTFIGRDAIAAGLADRFGTVEEILAELSAKKPTPSKQKGTTMLPTEANTDTIAQARAEERSRIKAILAAPEAQGRQNAALHLALSSDMGLDNVRATLGGLPMELSERAQQHLAAKRTSVGEDFGSSAPNQPAQEQVEAGWKSAFARVQASR